MAMKRVYMPDDDGDWGWQTVDDPEDDGGGGGGSQTLAQVLAEGGDPDGNPITGNVALENGTFEQLGPESYAGIFFDVGDFNGDTELTLGTTAGAETGLRLWVGGEVVLTIDDVGFGFFGHAVTAQPAAPSSAQDIADALADLGLVATGGTVGGGSLPEGWTQGGDPNEVETGATTLTIGPDGSLVVAAGGYVEIVDAGLSVGGGVQVTDGDLSLTSGDVIVSSGKVSAADVDILGGALSLAGGTIGDEAEPPDLVKTLRLNAGGDALQVTGAGAIAMNLPAVDPEVAGALWVDPAAAFVVKVSQG